MQVLPLDVCIENEKKYFSGDFLSKTYIYQKCFDFTMHQTTKKNFILDMIGNKSYSYTGICEKCIVLLYMYIFTNKYTTLVLYKKKLWFNRWKKYQTNTKQKQLGVVKSKLYNITSEPNLKKMSGLKINIFEYFFLNSLY